MPNYYNMTAGFSSNTIPNRENKSTGEQIMKKLMSLFLCLLTILLLAGSAAAFNVDSAGNKFDQADSVIADKAIDGDYVAFGSNIKLESGVKGDIIAGGMNIIITDDAAVQNIFAAGQNISVRAKSVRNIYAAGGIININSGTTAGGVYLMGATVTFGGTATDVNIAAPIVTVDGTVYDNLTIRSDRITFGRNVTVNGHVTIYGTVKPKMPPNIDESKVTFKRVIHNNKNAQTPAGGISRFKVIAAIISVVTAVVLALVLTLFWGGWFRTRSHEFNKRAWKMILWGLLAFIVTPVIALVCMVTLVGIPVGVIALALYAVLLYLSPVISGVVLGRRYLPKMNRFLAAGLGAAAISILMIIPYVKFVLFLATAFYTLGVIVTGLKPRRTEPPEEHLRADKL
jgi:hypothetical protein